MTTMIELDSVTSSSETEYLEWHLRNTRTCRGR